MTAIVHWRGQYLCHWPETPVAIAAGDDFPKAKAPKTTAGERRGKRMAGERRGGRERKVRGSERWRKREEGERE